MESSTPFKTFLALLLFTGLSPAFGATDSLREQIRDAALRASVDPRLVEAIVRVESNGDRRAKSAKGAMGLMQVMPQTARDLEIYDPHHSVNNLMGACQYLRGLINRYQGNLELALAAYNAGPRNVDRYGGVPPFPETKKYVRRVLGHFRDLKNSPITSIK